jgi:hypothetical protein
MRPDAPCNEASDENICSQCTAEERLRPVLEGRVEDPPLQEKELVRRIVSSDYACPSPGLVPSPVCRGQGEHTTSAEPQQTRCEHDLS